MGPDSEGERHGRALAWNRLDLPGLEGLEQALVELAVLEARLVDPELDDPAVVADGKLERDLAGEIGRAARLGLHAGRQGPLFAGDDRLDVVLVVLCHR